MTTVAVTVTRPAGSVYTAQHYTAASWFMSAPRPGALPQPGVTPQWRPVSTTHVLERVAHTIAPAVRGLMPGLVQTRTHQTVTLVPMQGSVRVAFTRAPLPPAVAAQTVFRSAVMRLAELTGTASASGGSGHPRATLAGRPGIHEWPAVLRSVYDRHCLRISTLERPPRTIGWYRTTDERRVPPPSMSVSIAAERSGATGSEPSALRQSVPTTTDFAKPDAALARTISDSLRSVTEIIRSEVRAAAPPPAAPALDISRLTKQVYEQLERELRIDRERRGL